MAVAVTLVTPFGTVNVYRPGAVKAAVVAAAAVPASGPVSAASPAIIPTALAPIIGLRLRERRPRMAAPIRVDLACPRRFIRRVTMLAAQAPLHIGQTIILLRRRLDVFRSDTAADLNEPRRFDRTIGHDGQITVPPAHRRRQL
jgi:hypothetical protein